MKPEIWPLHFLKYGIVYQEGFGNGPWAVSFCKVEGSNPRAGQTSFLSLSLVLFALYLAPTSQSAAHSLHISYLMNDIRIRGFIESRFSSFTHDYLVTREY